MAEKNGASPTEEQPPIPKAEFDEANAEVSEDGDHVIEHQIMTQTFAKEDRALHRLADIQRQSQEDNTTHLAYKPNPYNRRAFPRVVSTIELKLGSNTRLENSARKISSKAQKLG